MLEELVVSNLGLIESAAIEPSDGLVVITGETGAGKTLLLGALGLLVGETARKDLIGPSGDEATVQARLSVEGSERVVVRRISRQGRSKAYLDGLMASAKQLAAAGDETVEIVGQHDHLRLISRRHVQALLDRTFDAAAVRTAELYATDWAEYVRLRTLAEQLGSDRHGLEREREMARFQADEIAQAAPTANEDEQLAAAANTHRHAAAIAEGLDAAADSLGEHGIEPLLDQALLALDRVAGLDPDKGSLAKQALDIASLVADLRSDVAGATSGISEDPAELDRLERRIAELGDLKRKYGDTVDKVIEYGRSAQGRAAELDDLLATASELDESLAEAETRVRKTGVALTKHRQRLGARLSAEATGHLLELGFTDPVVQVALTTKEPGPTGCDGIELLFASSAELEPRPVGRIASGGELSRLVLAIRLAAGVTDTGIVAFDEIDAGVGGTAALALGQKLARLSADRQVFCVTHLPQVAAYADTHLVVRRSGDVTDVEAVDGDGRVEELSRMLAGMPDSLPGKDHAAELLAAAGADKV